MRDLIIFNEATPETDIIIRHPLPLCTTSEDYKFTLYGALPPSTPITGDAGPVQTASTSIVLISDDYSFNLTTTLLLDFEMRVLAHLIDEESILAPNPIVGVENGKTIYLGSRPDKLSFYLLADTSTVQEILAKTRMKENDFLIRFKRHSQVWWEGKAKTSMLAEVRREPGATREILHLLWVLEGQKGAIAQTNMGVVEPDPGPYQSIFRNIVLQENDFESYRPLALPSPVAISGDAGISQNASTGLIVVGSDYSFSLVFQGEFNA